MSEAENFKANRESRQDSLSRAGRTPGHGDPVRRLVEAAVYRDTHQAARPTSPSTEDRQDSGTAERDELMGGPVKEPKVESVMTRSVITVRPETTFKDVVGALAGEKISAMPVVDGAGRPVGVVSEADALAKEEFHAGADTPPWWAGFRLRARARKATGLTAADLMTTPAVTIGAEEPVVLAARRLAGKRLRRLFVLDADGVLVGVISRRDILGMYLRTDGEIAKDVEQQVLRRDLWLIPGEVTVSVTDGVVTLEGVVEQRSIANVAERLALAVPGVVAAHNNLRYSVDDTTSTAL